MNKCVVAQVFCTRLDFFTRWSHRHFYSARPQLRPQTEIIHFQCIYNKCINFTAFEKSINHWRLKYPVIHCRLSNIASALGVSRLWHLLSVFVFPVCQLLSVCMSRHGQQQFTSQRGVLFCLLRSPADRDPLSAAPHCKHKSHCNECVTAGESEQAKCNDVPGVLAVCRGSALPHYHLQ